MRTIEMSVFKYDELIESAKAKALHQFNESSSFYDTSENTATMKGFQAIFPVHVDDWEYGYGHHVNFTFLGEDEVEQLKGVRLATYINNNYHADLFQGKYYSTQGKYIDGKYTYRSRRSKTMLDNNCVLTGFYLDDVILNPVYEFLKNPSDNVNFSSLMRDCLNAWIKACNDSFEYYYSEENFKDMCEGNEWEFFADGKML